MFIRDNEEITETIEPRDGPYPGKVTKECPLCEADGLNDIARHLPECPER
jgi:hypothetical protein